MGVLQDALAGGQLPAGQHGVAYVHVAVQVHEARHQPRERRHEEGVQPADGGMAQQQIQAQPDAAHRQSHQRQTHQHFLTSLLVPPPQGAGDRQKHPPGHGKPVQPLTQSATLLSTGGAVPPSAHIPRQIPPPACGRSPQGPGGMSPSTSRRSRRPATARRRRRQSGPGDG